MNEADKTEKQLAESGEMVAKKSDILVAMNRIFREALVCATQEQLAKTILGIAEDCTDSKFGWIGELNPSGGFDTIALSGRGWEACSLPDSEATPLPKNMGIRGIWGRVLTDGQPVIVNDRASHSDLSGVPEGLPPLTCLLGVPLKHRNWILGMIVLANKESDYEIKDQEVVEALSGAIVEALRHKSRQEALRRAILETLQILSEVVEASDPYATGHSERVTELAIEIANKMQLEEDQIDILRIAGRLHDVGKIGIPGSVLNKPTKLAQAEWQMIRAHPLISVEIAERIAVCADAVPAIRHHHELWDGTGYPDGLKNKKIPVLARILAVADAFEAMTCERPYRGAKTEDEALAELEKGAGTRWDPEVVEAFLKIRGDKVAQ